MIDSIHSSRACIPKTDLLLDASNIETTPAPHLGFSLFVRHLFSGLVSDSSFRALLRLFLQLHKSTASTEPGRGTILYARTLNAVLLTEFATFPPQEHARAARERDTLAIDGAKVLERWILFPSRRFAEEDTGDVRSTQTCFQGIEKVPKVVQPGSACHLLCRWCNWCNWSAGCVLHGDDLGKPDLDNLSRSSTRMPAARIAGVEKGIRRTVTTIECVAC